MSASYWAVFGPSVSSPNHRKVFIGDSNYLVTGFSLHANIVRCELYLSSVPFKTRRKELIKNEIYFTITFFKLTLFLVPKNLNDCKYFLVKNIKARGGSTGPWSQHSGGRSTNFRLLWATLWVGGQPSLHSEIYSQRHMWVADQKAPQLREIIRSLPREPG